jgi:hypothetical protein
MRWGNWMLNVLMGCRARAVKLGVKARHCRWLWVCFCVDHMQGYAGVFSQLKADHQRYRLT